MVVSFIKTLRVGRSYDASLDSTGILTGLRIGAKVSSFHNAHNNAVVVRNSVEQTP